MDYKKKYKEALERAREALNEIPLESYGARKIIIDAFPELTESEDERMIKWLHYLIEIAYTTDLAWDIPKDDTLAWLEKQKEQKPDIEICPHSIKSKSYKENSYPIENCDYGLEIAENILEKTLGKVEGFQTDDGIREHQTAIQAVRDAMKEQKPAEYLDKDKVYAIMTKLTNLSYSQLIPINSNEYKKIDEITGDVRSLLDYPIEPKPAEWSEEDEKVIEAASTLLCEYAGYYKEKDMEAKNLQLFRVSQRLKSLRPSWKPSEEQMKALQCAIVFMEIRKASDYDITPLKLLYEHLKKLM